MFCAFENETKNVKSAFSENVKKFTNVVQRIKETLGLIVFYSKTKKCLNVRTTEQL